MNALFLVALLLYLVAISGMGRSAEWRRWFQRGAVLTLGIAIAIGPRAVNDRSNNPNRGRAGLERARLELHEIESMRRSAASTRSRARSSRTECTGALKVGFRFYNHASK
jgi:hypothetical protein